MRTIIIVASSLFFVCLLLIQREGRTQDLVAPATQIVEPFDLSAGPRSPHDNSMATGQHDWMFPDEAAISFANAPQAANASDAFGYIFSSVQLDWINAATGTDTGIGHDTDGVTISAAIPIGFDFDFYENTYSQVYVSSAGSIAFNRESLRTASTPHVPSPAAPNNMIAAYLAPLFIDAANDESGIFYKHVGASPNRSFVVQWHEVIDSFGNEYTFQIILHENGDIVLQYLIVRQWPHHYCGTFVGIEDSHGTDSLAYRPPSCYSIRYFGGTAIRFVRPAPSARIGLTPRRDGGFASAGEKVDFQFQIRNTGDLGADTYDVETTSAWPVLLVGPENETPLTDTDSDGLPDTGSLEPGQVFTATARIQVPITATQEANTRLEIVVLSSLDESRQLTSQVDLSIPRPFVQLTRDRHSGDVVLLINHQTGQTGVTIAGNSVNSTAVAETPDYSQVVAWGEGGCPLQPCERYRSDLYFAIVDRFGRKTHPKTYLSDMNGVDISNSNSPLSIAVTPDGHIGFLWARFQYDADNLMYNDNLYFAIANDEGKLIHGPENITGNEAWTSGNSHYVPFFNSPSITATGDNRFALVWEREESRPPDDNCGNDCLINDIYFAVRNSDGAEIASMSQLTFDEANNTEGYQEPNVTRAGFRNVLVTFHKSAVLFEHEVQGVLLDSDGDIITPMTSITESSSDYDAAYKFGVDAVQLDDGNYLVAWHGFQPYPPAFEASFIGVTRVNDALERQARVDWVDSVIDLHNFRYLSVTSTSDENGIVTWNDSIDSGKLWYRLVNGNDGLSVPPAIFDSNDRTLYLATNGQNNGPYSWEPRDAVDGVVETTSTLIGGVPGGRIPIPISLSNHGAQLATGTAFSATLADGLSYAGDTLGILPAVNGQEITWNLRDMPFLHRESFTLFVNMASAAEIGQHFNVDLALQTDQPDNQPIDNETMVSVMAAEQVFLPSIRYPLPTNR